MKQNKFQALKMKLIMENDFTHAMTYFFDHFSDNDAFTDRGGPLLDKKHPIFQQVPATAAIMLAASGVELGSTVKSDLRPVYVAEEKFVHGSATMQGHLVVFFYFEDLDVGMLCITTPDGMTRLAIDTAPQTTRQTVFLERFPSWQ